MKKILISVVIVFVCVINLALLTENDSNSLDLTLKKIINITNAQAEDPGAGSYKTCYDGYDSPSFWRDDEFKRICSTCDMYEGHDFCEKRSCLPS